MRYTIRDVSVGTIVTLRDRRNGYETKHLVQRVGRRSGGKWVLYVGALNVPYLSEHYSIVRAADDWSDES
jgi:hypothetical protein